MKKRILSLVLSAIMLLTMIPFAGISVYAEGDATFSYFINDDGAWLSDCSYSGDGAVEIPATLGGSPVVAIDYSAFDDCINMTAVTIPDSVVKISSGAFSHCTALASISIGSGVRDISTSAFEDTAYFSDEDNWVDGVLYIGNYLIRAKENITGSYEIKTGTLCIACSAFMACDELEGVSFPESLIAINDNAFQRCEKLKAVDLPDAVSTIGSNAFADCYVLENVELGSGLKSIGYSAFYGCAALAALQFPEGLESIGNTAFSYTALETVTIPASVKDIKSETFDYCYSLEEILVDEDNQNYASHEGVLYTKDYSLLIDCPTKKTGTYAIHEDTASIMQTAFFRGGLTEVIIPSGVFEIGHAAFDECSSLTSIYVSPDNAAYSSHEGVLYDKIFTKVIRCPGGKSGSYEILDTAIRIGSGAFMFCGELKSVIIPDSVLQIWDGAFYGCNSLESIDFGSGVQEIYNTAFNGCSALTEVTIPNSVRMIKDRAFYECDQLETITLGTGIRELGENVFAYTAYYNDEENWEGGVLYLGGYLLEGYDVAGDYAIKAGTIGIADSAFCYNYDLTAVSAPDSMKYFGRSAFYGCESLAQISLGNAVERVGEECFEGTAFYDNEENWEGPILYCGSALIAADGNFDGSCNVKVGTTCIGAYAFNYCQDLAAVQLPIGLIGIGECAFYECEQITELAIPDTVKFIESYAFSECGKIGALSIPGSVKYIGEHAFEYCLEAESIDLESEIEWIGDWAFSDCDAVEEIKVPGSVKYLGYASISFCNHLASIIVENGIKTLVESVFCENYNLKSVRIPESVISIEDYAFSDCGLQSLTIPNSVKHIGFYAFFENPFEEIILGKGIESIEVSAFQDCEELQTVWYGGTEADKEEILINGLSNNYLLDADWYFNGFSDVPISHWAAKGILYCNRRGLMVGMNENEFSPNSTLTRAQIVTILYSLEGKPPVSGSSAFSDVADGVWYANAVKWASQNGVVSGVGGGRFAPDKPVTRAEFATMLYAYTNHVGGNTSSRADLSTFVDYNSLTWEKTYMEWAVAEGLLSGNLVNNVLKIDPTGQATRAQGAIILRNFCEN